MPGQRRRAAQQLLVATVAAALATPGAALAATLTLDRACYVSGRPGRIALAGFTPRVHVIVAGPELGSTVVTTDDAGAAGLPLTPPAGSELSEPGSRAFILTATEQATPSIVARATARIAPRAFASADVAAPPKALRAWAFSGWTPGRPLYVHVRRGGRTTASHRFGLATGPCGELTARAPGIAGAGPIRTGLWTLQIDQRADFSPLASPALRAETVVFPAFPAPGTAGLVTAAPGGLPRFF